MQIDTPCKELEVNGNDVLENIDGLANVTSVGASVYIANNPSLTTVDGLSGLTEVDSWIQINGNHSLVSIKGMSGLTYVGDFIRSGACRLPERPSVLVSSGHVCPQPIDCVNESSLNGKG